MTRATSRPALQTACFLLLLTAWGDARLPLHRHTRATSHRAGTAAYDKCSHPFHAWMCESPSRSRVSSTSSTGKQITVAQDTLPLQDPQLAPHSLALTTPTPPTTSSVPQHRQDFPPDTAPSRPVPQNTSAIPELTPSPTTSLEPRRGSILFSKPPTPNLPPLPQLSPLPSKARPKAVQQEPHYDHCSHPFHAWLCSAAARPRSRLKPERLPTPRSTPRPTQHPTHRPSPPPTSRPALQTTQRPTPLPIRRPTKQSSASPSPDASNTRKDLLLLPQTSTTPRPYDVCSHPFHSWRCERPRLRPKPSTLGKSIKPAPDPPKSRPPSKIQTLPTPTPLLPKPSWDGADPCTHAFHSWLCNRSASSSRSRPRLISRTRPHSRPRPRLRPTQKPVADPVLDPAASFPVEAPALSSNNFRATPTPSPASPQLTTTQRRGKSNDPEPQAEPEPSRQDVCRHPFHSFLCSSPRPTSSPAPTSVPAKIPVAAPAFLTPRTKVKPPREQGSLPASLPQRGHLCNHPFHAWLCGHHQHKKHHRSSTTLPPGRNKVMNTVTDSIASSPNKTLLTTASPRPVPTVPPQSSLSKDHQTPASLQTAPSTLHLVVYARPLTWFNASVSSPLHTSDHRPVQHAGRSLPPLRTTTTCRSLINCNGTKLSPALLRFPVP
ncbi:mucin-2-like [Portunus trituberculatus]|uniref:mucin-2-like n=1 Tax=Portunus trituberculatus TaxID=210409 RepID=UPI001E1CE58E|nr:mucin-2-like [Portunus trituberculatus]